MSNIRGERWLFALIVLAKLVKRRKILDIFQYEPAVCTVMYALTFFFVSEGFLETTVSYSNDRYITSSSDIYFKNNMFRVHISYTKTARGIPITNKAHCE